VAQMGEIDAFHLPRSAQLINKSNQFHLTTTRYGEAEIKAMLAGPHWQGRHFSLKDRFGDNGLISVVLLNGQGEDAVIDTWVMSCRVLGRGMEEFITNELVQAARAMGCRRLIGRYIPSKKNKLVSELYPRLGFAPIEGRDGEIRWSLDLETASALTTFIARV
jgi:FkbH-like protein